MTTERPRPLVAGNWKMNGTRAATKTFAAILEGYDAALRSKVDLLVCPPATLTYIFAVAAVGTPVKVGGQDCHAATHGAHTGDISAPMLADAGASYVIVGHSERRTDHGESDATVKPKAPPAIAAGLTPVVCVGETREERDAGRALAVVGAQLAGSMPDEAAHAPVVVAYEPVWAIGTGLTPTVADVAEMHGFIRQSLVDRFGAAGRAMRLLYGGSVKPGNARELLGVAEVDGALVGGASLVAEDFLAIARSYIE